MDVTEDTTPSTDQRDAAPDSRGVDANTPRRARNTPPLRSVIKLVDWTVEPDREPDAKPYTYAMECDVCCEGSPRSTDPQSGCVWILGHVKTNPSHHSYTEIIKRGWRAWMEQP
ncbi:hypothetical protein ACFP1Z_07235 [Streptomyces gamaensis]|uniref:DUF7848 domain-containing protein n=1 Tax=Streptomyces gamaensis TaxID=1763542 RepID=A0ABW0YZZ3_9ACTN